MPNKNSPLIEFDSVVKRFPGVVANDGVTFTIDKGTIHSLLGENGAGKTTLMNILYGLYQQDQGSIYLRGKEFQIESPTRAIELGIGMVHQHFKLVQNHTVAENIALGLPSASTIRPTTDIKRKLLELAGQYGLKVDPDAKIWQLSAGEKQRVEILRALYRGAKTLILDEPTSVLTPGETERLFTVLEDMKSEGRTIIFITHKLDEVMEISDVVTVLREGKVVDTVDTASTDKSELSQKMVGREVLFDLDKPSRERGQVTLEVQDLNALNDKRVEAINDLSFSVHEGEILGIAGVAGNGQRELAEVLTGLRKATSGKVLIDGEDMTNTTPRKVSDRNVAHIPEDRIHQGIVGDLTLKDNVILKGYRKEPFSKGLVIDYSLVDEHTRKIIEDFNIKVPDTNTPANLLSGGNIQRLILGREVSSNPKLIIASHPTYGLDVAAAEQIRQLLLEQKGRGVGILLISENLTEVTSISDRIAVLFEGKIMGTVESGELEREELGMLMAGTPLEELGRREESVKG
ncbi:MAG: ABC transporter ATP-binding protein [Candidatus Bipolaricaulota bacterium]|nr:ABC transporter ATP-binding protein [Candidatus Bipolaricaulota bacterium]MBS3791849.1 ABC transporter ATP-binding protein [Candidatus Bipolaricaulota bacterium]